MHGISKIAKILHRCGETKCHEILSKRVRQALKVGKKKWLEEEMREMEEDI